MLKWCILIIFWIIVICNEIKMMKGIQNWYTYILQNFRKIFLIRRRGRGYVWMEWKITYSGIRFEWHSEKSARSEATRCSRPCDNEHQIFSYHFPVFIHRQERPQTIVRGISYIHTVSYQAIATVREHQQLTDATRYVKRESDASSKRGIFLGVKIHRSTTIERISCILSFQKFRII